MSRPIPNVTLGGFRPNQVKINSIGIGIDDDTLNTLNLDSTQYMVVGKQTNDIYNMIVDSEGIIVNSSIINRAAYSNEYALFVDGNIFVTGKVDTSSGTLSNVAGGGSGSACNFWMPVRENLPTSTNIYYEGKINIANESQSRGNAYRVNIVDNANRTINHAQLAIQNQVGSVGRIAILGYSNLSPFIVNSSRGPIEFHANRTDSYFSKVYYRSNVITSNLDALDVPFYATNDLAPQLSINVDGTVGVKISPSNSILNYTLRTVDDGNPNIVRPTTIANKPADLQINGTTYSCNMLIFDYESRQARNIDDLYIRRFGVTFAASQVEPGNFAPGSYTFLSNVSIGGPTESGCNLTVYGKVHMTDQLYVDKAVLSSNVNIENTFQVLGTSYFENDVIVNNNLQVNENLIIWGGFYSDSNAMYTFVPGSNSNEIANIQFINYIANGWSNIYMQGAGFITPGMVGIGINPQNPTDQVPSQLSIISRNKDIYGLSLYDKTDINVTKAMFVGHQRSNIIKGFPDASVIFSTPSSTNPLFVNSERPYEQNFYFYPGQYDKTITGNPTIIDTNPPILGIYESKQVSVNSFKPVAALQFYTNGSIGYSSNIYKYDEETNTTTRIAEFKYRQLVGINNALGISYNDPTSPYVGINKEPDSKYGLSVQGGISADRYYTQNNEKGYIWLDSATNEDNYNPTTTNGLYVISKVGIGNNQPQFMLDIYGDNSQINNNYGTYMRFKKSSLEGMSNTGIRIDGAANPWFVNMESVSHNISRFAIGSSSNINNFVDANTQLIPIYWTNFYSSNNNTSNIYNIQTVYDSPILTTSNLSINSSNIFITSNITYTYNITNVSNVYSNITSNINGLPNLAPETYSISYDYTSNVLVTTLLNIITTSNYSTPLFPVLSNIFYASNITRTSNIINTSNTTFVPNSSNYIYSSNNTGLLIQYDASRENYGHQVVIGGNAAFVTNSLYNLNPNPYATLTVNGDTSIIGNLNVTGYITANNAVKPMSSIRSNVPAIQQDDLFISGKDLYMNPTNKLYINYTCNLLEYPLETANPAVLNVYQDIDNSLSPVPVPIAHFISKGDKAFIEIISEAVQTSGGVNDGVLRIGLLTGDINRQIMGVQDGSGYTYMSFKKSGNTQRAMGINTNNPDAQLHIVNDDTILNNIMMRITYDNGIGGDTGNYSPNIVLEKTYIDNTSNNLIEKKWFIEGPIYGTNNDRLSFKYQKSVIDPFGNQTITSNTTLSIASNGCIGINTTTPKYLIDIVTSNIADNHGVRLWNKIDNDVAQLIFQSGESPDVGGDTSSDYIMYSCNNEFIFRQRNSILETNPLLYYSSNTNLGINSTPSLNYNVNVGGKLNVTDSIYVNGIKLASAADYTADGYVIIGSNNIFMLPNTSDNGGIVVNSTVPTSNLFHIFNDNTNSPNMMVYDSELSSVEINMRNKIDGDNIFNIYKIYTSNNNFGVSYKDGYNRSFTLPTSGWNNVFNITSLYSTGYSEHDVSINGNLELYSDVRGIPKITFGSNGEIGGVNNNGNIYMLATANIGIGTTIPLAPLHVHANVIMGNGLDGSYNDIVGGPFFKQESWDSAKSSHTITYPFYCVGDNSTGTLYIQITNKSTNPSTIKLGNIQVSFIKPYNTPVITNVISTHKNLNINTLIISSSVNNIVVTTDNDCSISWTSIGSF